MCIYISIPNSWWFSFPSTWYGYCPSDNCFHRNSHSVWWRNQGPSKTSAKLKSKISLHGMGVFSMVVPIKTHIPPPSLDHFGVRILGDLDWWSKQHLAIFDVEHPFHNRVSHKPLSLITNYPLNRASKKSDDSWNEFSHKCSFGEGPKQ